MSKGTPKVSWAEGQRLQKDLDRAIHALEQAGLLREADGNEIRTIAAENIADVYGERYRCYAVCARPDNLEIRRDRMPPDCVLVTRLRERSYAVPKQSEVNEGSPENATSIAGYSSSMDHSVDASNQRVQDWCTGVTRSSHSTSSAKKPVKNNWHNGVLSTAEETTWKLRLSRGVSTDSSCMVSTEQPPAYNTLSKGGEAIEAPLPMMPAQTPGSASKDKDPEISKPDDDDGLQLWDSAFSRAISEAPVEVKAKNEDGNLGGGGGGDDDDDDDHNDLMTFSDSD